MKLIPLAEAELQRFPVQTQVSALMLRPKINFSTLWQPSSSFSVLFRQLYVYPEAEKKVVYDFKQNFCQN